MTTALARRFKVDVSPDNSVWTNFKGITDLTPKISPNLNGADDYDSNGWGSQEKVLQSWTLTIKALRKTIAGVFDPGQELVRTNMLNFGDTARIFVRWYDRNGAPEAFTGWGIIQWEPSKTGVADLDEIQVTLTGDGAATAITNPFSPTAIPTISAVTPTGASVGTAVRILGTGFTGVTGATGVKFNAVNASSYTVISDNEIIAVMPAGSAGSAPVLVTNLIGPNSPSFAYTRGA